MDRVSVDISLPAKEQRDVIDRKQVDLEYLKAYEIKLIPSVLQGYLFKPSDSPIWKPH